MGWSVSEEAQRSLEPERIDLQIEQLKSRLAVDVRFRVDGGVREGGRQQEDRTSIRRAGDVGELAQDAQDVGVVQMLHHHARHDEVEVGDVDRLRDDVEVDELPRPAGERRPMMLDHAGDDVDARVVDVRARLQKSTHPLQISARYVQQANAFNAEVSLQLTNNHVKSGRHLLGVIQRRTGSYINQSNPIQCVLMGAGSPLCTHRIHNITITYKLANFQFQLSRR